MKTMPAGCNMKKPKKYQTKCQKARLEKSTVRPNQKLTTDELVYDFGLTSCDELTK